MSLKEYEKKRDFKKTPEPSGKKSAKSQGNRYLIQKHAASRLHYDFRLELDGVLLSWAVPKGPSFDPSEKRLAVHVEDHPVDYGDFEGTIPKGQYGGGTVMLWDQGTWEPIGDAREELKNGKIAFLLNGQRLSGKWALIQMRGARNEDGKNWLLVKEKDDLANPDYDVTEAEPNSVISGRTMEQIAKAEDAVWQSNSKGSKKSTKPKAAAKKKAAKASAPVIDPSSLPKAKKSTQPKELKPELATLVKDVPQGEGWLHEIKFDGYRLLAMLSGGKARLLTRNGKDWTRKFPAIAQAVEALPVSDGIFDGEVVVMDEQGISNFQKLQNALKGGKNQPLAYYIFDLPWCGGYDLTSTPLLDRKELLKQILDSAPEGLHFSDHIAGQGTAVYEHACQFAMEGIISKRENSPYMQKRAKDWVKVKCTKRQEFVIGGYTEPGGSRSHFGALLLGIYNDGGELLFSGKVGTGFTDDSLKQLHAQMKKHEQKTPPFVNPPKGREAKGVTWLSPKLVGEVEFTEWTEDGILRHPSFQGLREDKEPKQIGREEADPPPETKASGKKKATRTTMAKTNGNATIAGIKLTNPDRVLYPEQGVTKQELARYYETIAEYMLPFVAHRPLSVVRCPQGQGEKCFFQKHIKEGLPDTIYGITVPERKSTEDYLAVKDAAGLVSLVQFGMLEIHPWGSREDKLEQPDILTFDLDPDSPEEWDTVIFGTEYLRDRLRDLGFTPYLKTSGGKGLHIVVPVARRADWDEAKAFTKAIAEEMAREEPKRFVSVMSKAKRKGKVFVDYLRNGRGATSVAPYSSRARTGAPVSMPVDWSELSDKLDPKGWNIESALERLKSQRQDPWADFWKNTKSITKAAMKKVGVE
jgi:bifunctional non-homologous end joining protein LigD